MKDFTANGFVVLKEFFPSSEVSDLRKKIKSQLESNAQELNVIIDEYLYCTGRWASPSKIVSCINKEIDFIIQQRLEHLLNKKIKMEKCNVICKNTNIRDAVPLHQDISYSPKSPYHFSLWLALNDVDANSGPLQFIKGSHKWPIESAVDFWSPEITSNKILEQKYQEQLQMITLKEGDAVIFDSRLWHGSTQSFSGNDRYAYVSRWEIVGQPFPIIPAIQPAFFGMWNCHQITHDILVKGLSLFNRNVVTNYNFIELIEEWQDLIHNNNLIKNIDKAKALKDLKNVKILHLAANKHNAGDLTGKIYKNLWYSLLCDLQNTLPITPGSKNDIC